MHIIYTNVSRIFFSGSSELLNSKNILNYKSSTNVLGIFLRITYWIQHEVLMYREQFWVHANNVLMYQKYS